MAPLETIERLVSFHGRAPGTKAERRAADHLAAELRELGREASAERIRVRPAYHITHALHAALAVFGTILSVRTPVLGAIVLLAVAASMAGDLTARFYLLRLLMPRVASANVTSRGPNPDAPARVVLTAHYDAARTGVIFARRKRPPGRLLRNLSKLGGPIDVVFWAVALELALSVLRLFTGGSTLLTTIQFGPTVLLIGAVILFVDIALSDVVPGASDNAAGVAAVQELGRRLAADPPLHLDTWLVFPGSAEGHMLGMRRWIRDHEGELDPRRTFFVNVVAVGRGTPRFVGGEGFVVLEQHDGRLVDLSRSVATGGLESTPLRLRFGTDGVIPVLRGFSSITVCCTDEHDRIPNHHRPSDSLDQIQPEAVEQTIAFVEALVRGIDERIVPAMLPTLAARPAPAST